MSSRQLLPRHHLETLLRAAFAASLVALALPAAAVQGSDLEISFGPHETNWLQLKGLKVLLDSAPLPVTLPSTDADADSALPIYSGTMKAGGHQIEVEAEFAGDSTAFPYVEGYLFRMRDQIDFDAPAGEAVRMQFRVVRDPGITVQWTDRFRLAMKASRHPSDRTAEIPEKLATNEPPAPEPVPEPVPEPSRDEPTRAACVLAPTYFAFAQHGLDADGRANLDQFTECIATNEDAVAIEGFADPRGSISYNKRLGEQRANEAAQYLIQRGVTSSRLTVRSFGETRLVCTERTPACYARNRRIEVVLQPDGSDRE